ncbi:MAG: hypothetical protein KGS72_10205 [Cyanobacteria bacterium REEB67]|nr:hypothetical protein [Cyanobacteria bacterium REEB67]
MARHYLLKTCTANQYQTLLACLLVAGLINFNFVALKTFAAEHTITLTVEPNSAARTLIFPSDLSLGFLHLEPRANRAEGGTRGKGMSVQARGKITVPKNTFVTFEANKEFFKNPALIGKFPANAFDSIILRMFSMDDAEDEYCDRAMPAISHLTGLLELNIDRSEVTDTGLKKIAGLTNLQHISAFLTPVRGEFLKDTTTLKKLRILELDSIGLKEDYLQHLPQYPDLVSLHLGHSHLSDKGLTYIAKCPKVEELDIGKNPAIDDQGLASLKNSKALRYLNIFDSAATPKGILALKGLKLKSIILPGKAYPEPVMAQLKTAFPEARITARWTKGKIDDDTKTIFSPMTR